jgi:hypothetical protein
MIGSLVTTGLSIKSQDGSSGYTLTASSTASLDSDQLQITVQLSDADLNQIKSNTAIGTIAGDSVLQVAPVFAADTTGNPLTEVAFGDTKIPEPFVPDQTPIEIISVTIDLGTGIITIICTEAVDESQLVYVLFSFLSSPTGSDRSRRAGHHRVFFSAAGSDASVDPLNPTVLVMQLGSVTINSVKAELDLCTTTANCFLAVGGGAIAGFDGLPNVVLSPSAPLGGITIIRDFVPPKLLTFALDMDEMAVTLSFDETVDASSFDKSTLEIQNAEGDVVLIAAADPTAVYPERGTVSEANLATIIVRLDSNDGNQIKAVTTLGTDVENTYVMISAETVKDMSDNAIDVHPAMKAISVTLDTTPPVLEGATLDMNIGVLTLTFDETVDTETLVEDSLVIQGLQTDGTNSIPLAVSGTRQDYVEVRIQLATDDLNALKQNTGVATEASTTFLTIAGDAIKDMNHVGIEPINALSTNAFDMLGYVKDETKPSLEKFFLNMTSGTLRLVFSETVDVDTLSIDHITLQCSDGSSAP